MKKTLLLIGFLSMNWYGYSQEESVSIESSTETMDTAQFSGLVRTYNSIIRAREEKLQLFKVDLLGPFFFLISNWDSKDAARNELINIAYEQKIKPNWSWIVGAAFKSDRSDFRELREEAGVRYYYNMRRRMLKGKSANNFSGNYFSSGFTYSHRFHNNDDQVSWRIMYGIQRRIGRRGFFDFEIGFEEAFEKFESREFGFELIANIKWGLAF